MKMVKKIMLFIGFNAFVFMSTAFASDEISVTTSTGDDFSITRYPAQGEFLILWFAPEYGFREPHRSLAFALSQNNIEVWQSDVIDSLFMPQGVSSIRELDGVYVADLIDVAFKKTGKKIIVMGDSYASVIALRGAHSWQRRPTKSKFTGAVLLSPYTYSSIPALGHAPEYLPIISSTNIPIMIYQAKNSGIISQFDTLVKKLQQHDSPVYTRFTPNVMSLFYEKNVTEQMKTQAERLPKNIFNMIRVLDGHDIPTKPVKLVKKLAKNNGIDSYLKKFLAKQQPTSIKLLDANGGLFTKNNFKDRVTVINFWATWCPPCIEEIPSLNRLKNKFRGKAFDLISINYAEDLNTIKNFMKKVNVEFQVLLDKNGEYAKQWNVITYPSTFIIDKNGHIVYGVNAAIEWDSSEVIEKIENLLK